MSPTLLGRIGEDTVADYLAQKGFELLARNFRAPKGEIDLIAQRQELVIFVEVKTRQAPCPTLFQVITPAKQRKIIAAARSFISTTRSTSELLYRFDVAFLIMAPRELVYIKDAFQANFPAW